MKGFGERLGFDAVDDELTHMSVSVVHWPPFSDTSAALKRLLQRYKLVIVSNIDDDLFAHSARLMNIQFDDVITAQQCGSYKPSLNNFEVALKRIGLPKEQVLHVAQSLFHDHVPAKKLGLTTAWVNRRKGKRGSGATPPAEAAPDLEVSDLKSLANILSN
jgi:2-haloacid dehalogenase